MPLSSSQEDILHFLNLPFQSQNNFINKRLGLLTQMCGTRAIDILFYKPSSYFVNNNINDAKINLHDYASQKISIEVVITAVLSAPFAKVASPSDSIKIEAECKLFDQTIVLQFFGGLKSAILAMFEIGKTMIVHGELAIFMDRFYINHPEICKSFYQAVIPVYGLTKGLTSRFVNACVNDVFARLKTFDGLKSFEWIDGSKNTFLKCLYKLHNPELQDLPQIRQFKNRLVFDELLARLLFVKKLSEQGRGVVKPQLNPDAGFAITQVQKSLGFELTGDQVGAVKFVEAQLANRQITTSLIQGDVGSGKTAVAIAAAIMSFKLGLQAAVIAPTFILASQHYKLFNAALAELGVCVELITSKDTKKQRLKKLELLKNGQIDVLIATHAAFEDSVEFARLGLVIVDEQQKFGVHQRLSILQKGCFENCCDIVFMTATPIPRTTAMIAFGNIASFEIKQKPANRKEVETFVLSQNKMDWLVNHIKTLVAKGQKTYWVCPLIDESDKSSLVPVTRRLNDLKEIFGEEAAMVHGKMKETEREEQIARFISGKIKVLIATTVIEVGVDVKDATTMVVENAERFGLSVLHQLRGRVGRGSLQSQCYFVHSAKIGKIGLERLNALKQSTDGFFIAQKDMQLRGTGQVFGKMQSGFNDFIFFDQDQDLTLQELACNLITHNFKYGGLNLPNQQLAEDILTKIFNYNNHNIVKA